MIDPFDLTVQVGQTTVTGRQEATVEIEWSERPEIKSTLNGAVITALAPPGSVLENGLSAVEIDGQTRPVWISDKPFHRQLQLQSRGQDVAELQKMLNAFGFLDASLIEVPQEAVFGRQTADAVEAFNKSRGGRGREFDPGSVMWLEEEGVVEAWEIELGSPLSSPGSVLGFKPAVVIDASIVVSQPLTLSGPATEHFLDVEGVRLGIGADGGVSSTDFATLATLARPSDSVTGHVELLEHQLAFSVPPAATIDVGDGFCVVRPNGESISVNVSGGRIGATLLDSSASLAVGDEILANPAASSLGRTVCS